MDYPNKHGDMQRSLHPVRYELPHVREEREGQVVENYNAIGEMLVVWTADKEQYRMHRLW
jgi:hypothetical protein